MALDLLGSVGLGHMLRRRRQERALFSLYPGMAVNRRIWDEAAARVGAEVEDLGGGNLEIGTDAARVPIRLHVTPIDDEAALARALDKSTAHRLLSEAGVPVPEQIPFDISDLGPARRALASGPCVVKPGGSSSGQGTTTGIRTEEHLRRAAIRASRSGGRMLLERQTPGEEYRVLILDGRPIGAVRRCGPAVVGDGSSSIAELVLAENQRRLEAEGEEGMTLLTIDLDALLALEHASLTPRSVPASGEKVVVKESRSQGGAADVETVSLDSLSPGLVSEAVAASEAIGLRLAGIDLVTPDIGSSLADAGGAAIEINGTPGLHYHYLVRDRDKAQRVAVPILETLLASA